MLAWNNRPGFLLTVRTSKMCIQTHRIFHYIKSIAKVQQVFPKKAVRSSGNHNRESGFFPYPFSPSSRLNVSCCQSPSKNNCVLFAESVLNYIMASVGEAAPGTADMNSQVHIPAEDDPRNRRFRAGMVSVYPPVCCGHLACFERSYDYFWQKN